MSIPFVLILSFLFLVSTTSFPPGFRFGASTAAYQVEGAAAEDGRKPSVWDVFSHVPGNVYNNETGDIADDQYHRFLDDIRLMSSLNIKHYRLSLSWTRIIPDGVGDINPLGVNYYNRLLNALISYGITPYVTIYHWDLPVALESQGGWLNESMIVPAFVSFARACFRNFGDRVNFWFTFNEPLTFVVQGYQLGSWPPQRCSDRQKCKAGNSLTEPYIAGHNVLLAHAAATQLYKKVYKATQQGQIGLVNTCGWDEPLTSSPADVEAAERMKEFECGWWADPVAFGDYPASMRKYLGSRLPKFTPQQSDMLKGSVDIFALNHYGSQYAGQLSICPTTPSNLADEACVKETITGSDGQPIGPHAASNWLYIVPWGMRKISNWLWQRYSLPIFVTENGIDEDNEEDPPHGLSRNLQDTWRISFHEQYLGNLSLAIQDGADVQGYFVWSLLDNFEWGDGYGKRFGLVYIDFKSNLTRIPKASANWYSNYIINGTCTWVSRS